MSNVLIKVSKNYDDQIKENAWYKKFYPFAIITIIGCTLFTFHDRDGFEGDDLSIISAVFDLDGAKRGDLYLYRFAWQPLSYETMSAIYRLIRSPDAIFLLPPLFGTISISILFLALSFQARCLKSPWVHLALIVLLPEFFYDSLFLNTTILGMPTASIALWLMASTKWPISYFRAGLVGALFAISTLFRFDFLIMIPFITALFWVKSSSPGQVLGFLFGGFLILLVAISFGWIQPSGLISILGKHHDEVNFGNSSFGWTWKANFLVIAVMMHLSAWLIILWGLPSQISDLSLRHGKLNTSVIVISALPLFYPMTSFVSPKYGIPLMILLPFFMLNSLEHLCSKWSTAGIHKLSITIVLVAIFSWMASIEPSKTAPFLRFTLNDAKKIGTHDGNRTLGAYSNNLPWFGADDSNTPKWKLAYSIVKSLDKQKNTEIWFVGNDDTFSPGGIGWRLVRIILERRGIHGECIAHQTYRYNLENGSMISLTVPSDFESRQQQELSPNSLRLDLSQNKLTDEEILAMVNKLP